MLRTACLTLLATLVLAGPAQAAQKYFLRTGTTKTPGKVMTKGTLSFAYGYGRLNGVLDDQCPGDDHGAYLEVTWRFRSAPAITQAAQPDERGCGFAPRSYAFRSPYKGVTSVTLKLREIDVEAGYATGDTRTRTLRRR